MRLFVGIDCGSLRETFLGLQRQLKAVEGASIKYVNHFHITLKFLGEMDDKQVEKVRLALREIKSWPFLLKFTHLGVFNPKRIRVVWAGGEPNEVLTKLNQDIEASLSKIVPEMKSGRDYEPHVTLGRVRSVGDKGAILEFVKKSIQIQMLNVESFILYNSVLTPEGPIYEVVEKYPIS